ncbi:MAG: hypothetical protein K9M00_05100 [Candidatus Omnitrophica bacterium]|nr:hypothetical protein [Candidatus Omnitrophota bacterium]
MNYPFIKKDKNKSYIKLCKEIYNKALIDKLKSEVSDAILSVKSQKDYYLLEIEADNKSDYFDFLNYLIYLKRN